MNKKVLNAYELPKWAKVSFDWENFYEFLWIDWMYWRFKDKDWMIWFAYWKFEYDDVKDLYICIDDKE